MQRALVLELDVPSRPEFIAIVRLVVASVQESIDTGRVSEACTNAIEANRAVRPSAPVHVEIWEAPDRLEVSIEDSGPGFDPDKLEFPPPVTDPQRLNFERGLGIPLIRTLVDSAAFVRKEKGTSVRMTVFGGPVDGDDTAAIYIDVSKMQDLPPAQQGT